MSIEASIPVSTISVDIQRVALRETVARNEFAVVGMDNLRDEAIRQFERMCRTREPKNPGFVTVLLKNFGLDIDVRSRILRPRTVAAPRRWWHRLLFLHPTEERVVWEEESGFSNDAQEYVISFSAFTTECPPDMVGSVQRRSLVFASAPGAVWA